MDAGADLAVASLVYIFQQVDVHLVVADDVVQVVQVEHHAV